MSDYRLFSVCSILGILSTVYVMCACIMYMCREIPFFRHAVSSGRSVYKEVHAMLNASILRVTPYNPTTSVI